MVRKRRLGRAIAPVNTQVGLIPTILDFIARTPVRRILLLLVLVASVALVIRESGFGALIRAVAHILESSAT